MTNKILICSTLHLWIKQRQLVLCKIESLGVSFLARIMIAVTKHHNPKRIGEKRVCLVYNFTSKEVRTGAPTGQEPEGRS